MNKNPDSQTQAPPLSTLDLKDMSDSRILEMIGRAAGDPVVANTLLRLQKQAYERLTEAVQRMLAKLNEIEPAQEKLPAEPASVAALASAARQREAAGKQKREFAESLVIGALINRDNPDWDIFDEAATPAPAGNGFLALLQMKPPAPADTSA